MSQQYLMAIDAGTGSVRAVIFSLDGEQTGCVQRVGTQRRSSLSGQHGFRLGT